MLPLASKGPQVDELPDGPCVQVGRPTVLDDGTVIACCNTEFAATDRSSPLRIGDMGSEGLSRSIENGFNSTWVRALRVLGPRWLAEQLPPECRPALPANFAEGDICSVCTVLCNQAALRLHIERALDAPATARLIDVLWMSYMAGCEDAFDCAPNSNEAGNPPKRACSVGVD